MLSEYGRKASGQENHCWQRFGGVEFVLEADLLGQSAHLGKIG